MLVAGIWNKFDEDWMFNEIEERLVGKRGWDGRILYTIAWLWKGRVIKCLYLRSE